MQWKAYDCPLPNLNKCSAFLYFSKYQHSGGDFLDSFYLCQRKSSWKPSYLFKRPSCIKDIALRSYRPNTATQADNKSFVRSQRFVGSHKIGIFLFNFLFSLFVWWDISKSWNPIKYGNIQKKSEVADCEIWKKPFGRVFTSAVQPTNCDRHKQDMLKIFHQLEKYI